jgi:hypothetical protein
MMMETTASASASEIALDDIARILGLQGDEHDSIEAIKAQARAVVAERDAALAKVAQLEEAQHDTLPPPAPFEVVASKPGVHYSIEFPANGGEACYVPLNGGHPWDERLAAVLASPRLNSAWAKMEFSFPPITRLQGGEEFDDRCATYVVVGHLPTKTKFGVCAVLKWKLDDPDCALEPNDLRGFATDHVVRVAVSSVQRDLIRQGRLTRYAQKYNVWPEAILHSGFRMTLGGLERSVRVADLNAVENKRPIHLVEVAGSVKPGAEWSVSREAFASCPRTAKRQREE